MALYFYTRRGILLSITLGKFETKSVLCLSCFLRFVLLRWLARYYCSFSNLVPTFSRTLNQEQHDGSRSKEGRGFQWFESIEWCPSYIWDQLYHYKQDRYWKTRSCRRTSSSGYSGLNVTFLIGVASTNLIWGKSACITSTYQSWLKSSYRLINYSFQLYIIGVTLFRLLVYRHNIILIYV